MALYQVIPLRDVRCEVKAKLSPYYVRLTTVVVGLHSDHSKSAVYADSPLDARGRSNLLHGQSHSRLQAFRTFYNLRPRFKDEKEDPK